MNCSVFQAAVRSVYCALVFALLSGAPVESIAGAAGVPAQQVASDADGTSKGAMQSIV